MDPPPHHQYRYPRPSQPPPQPPLQQIQKYSQGHLNHYSSSRHSRYSSHDNDLLQQYMFQLNNSQNYQQGDRMLTLNNDYHEQPQDDYLSSSFRSSGSHMPTFSDTEDIFATGNASVINEYEQTSFQLEDYFNDPMFTKHDVHEIVNNSSRNSLNQRHSNSFANVSLDNIAQQQLQNSQPMQQYQQQHQRSHLYTQHRRSRGNSRAPPPLRPPPSNPPPLAPQMSSQPPNQQPPQPPILQGSNQRQPVSLSNFNESIHFDMPEYMSGNNEYPGMSENAPEFSRNLNHQKLFDDFDRQFEELDQPHQCGSLMSPIRGNDQHFITPRHSYDLSSSSVCSTGVIPPQPQFAPSSAHNSMIQESPILQSPMNFPSQNWLAHSLANYHHQRNSSLFSHHRHSSLLSNGNYSHSSIMSQPLANALQHKQLQHQHQVSSAKKEKRNSQNQNQYHFINYEGPLAASLGLGLGLQQLSTSSSKQGTNSKNQTPSRGQQTVKGPFIVETPMSLQKQQELQEKGENPRQVVPQVAEQSTPLESRNPVINKALDKVESKTNSLDTQAFEDMLSSLNRVPLIKREHSPMEEEITADDFFKALELDDQDFFAIETSSSSNLTANSSTLTLAQQQQQQPQPLSSQTTPLLSIHQLHQQNQTATQLQFIPFPPSVPSAPSLSLQSSTTPTHHKSQQALMSKLQLDMMVPGSTKLLRTKKSMPILSSTTSANGSINKKSLKKSQSYSKLLNKRHSSTSVSPSTSGPIPESGALPGGMNHQVNNKGSFSLSDCSSSFSIRSSNFILENYNTLNNRFIDDSSASSTVALLPPPPLHYRKSSMSSVGSGTEHQFVMTGPPIPKEPTKNTPNHTPPPQPPKHLKNMESGIFSFQVQLNK